MMAAGKNNDLMRRDRICSVQFPLQSLQVKGHQRSRGSAGQTISYTRHNTSPLPQLLTRCIMGKHSLHTGSKDIKNKSDLKTRATNRGTEGHCFILSLPDSKVLSSLRRQLLMLRTLRKTWFIIMSININRSMHYAP